MSFDVFLAHIASTALRDVAGHWDAVRGNRRMPAWRDIDPAGIARHLPIVWSWRFDRDREDFIGRLAGEEINIAFGRALRGAAMRDFFTGFNYPLMFSRNYRVMSEPCFMRGHGNVFIHTGGLGHGERIIMPLGDDGETGDGVFGATVYSFNVNRLAAKHHRLDIRDEKMEFFPLV